MRGVRAKKIAGRGQHARGERLEADVGDGYMDRGVVGVVACWACRT